MMTSEGIRDLIIYELGIVPKSVAVEGNGFPVKVSVVFEEADLTKAGGADRVMRKLSDAIPATIAVKGV